MLVGDELRNTILAGVVVRKVEALERRALELWKVVVPVLRLLWNDRPRTSPVLLNTRT
jgi:hypothetical protein